MTKVRMAGLLALISTAFLICACGLLPKFTVHLPGRTVEIEIPDTGKMLDETDFGDHEVIRGSGDMVTVDRVVKNFDRISITGLGEVNVEQGKDPSLSVTVDDNLLEYLQTEVENGTLILGFDPEKAKRKDLRPSDPVNFDITVPDLSGIAIYGSGDVKSEYLNLDRFSLEIYGSGDVRIDRMICAGLSINVLGLGDIEVDDLEADYLDVSILGKGTVELAGEVVEQDINLPGMGKYLAGKLQSQIADVRMPGMADAKIWVTDELYADITGGGELRYYGNPKIYHSGPNRGDLESLGNQ